MILEKTRSRSLIEKPIKIPKRRKPIAKKSRFRDNSNPFKQYKARHSQGEVRLYAEQCRRTRLGNPTEAERDFGNILHSIGLTEGKDFEREKIIIYADRFMLVDFFLCRGGGQKPVCIEIDGGVHSQQIRFDQQRDSFCESLGYAVQRFTNKEVLTQAETVKAKIRELIA